MSLGESSRTPWSNQSQQPLRIHTHYSLQKEFSMSHATSVTRRKKLTRACLSCACCHVRLFAIPWTVALQAPLSMGFSRQDYWSGLPFASPGDLPDPGIKPKPSAVAAGFFTTEPPGKSSSQITSQIFQHEFVFCTSPRKYDQNIPPQVLFSCCPSTLPFGGRRLKSPSIQGTIYPFSTLEKPPFI